ncbi:hypothetical protein L596_030908 [Steinernema carpocapsae]|uniref:Peptidase M13 C-terminal domain-containing protein n=1 Tax=Steinernema carpocapsae TaxID=34508 RepID=A0A4U5MH93_STECR|nr:hypothetical protein L596_030908 [Steinernema carpocapsae]
MTVFASFLFIVVCPVFAASESFFASSIPSAQEIKSGFNANVSVCQDLHTHVCNYENLEVERYLKARREGMDELLAGLMPKDEPVYNAIYKALHSFSNKIQAELHLCSHQNLRFPYVHSVINAEAHGRHIGGLFALGRCTHSACAMYRVFCEEQWCMVVKRVPSSQSAMVFKPFKAVSNAFIKGIVFGYMKTLLGVNADLDSKMIVFSEDLRPEDFELEYLRAAYDEDGFLSFMEKHFGSNVDENLNDLEKRIQLIKILAKHRNFAPYFNLLFAHLLYQNRNVTKPEIADDLEAIMVDINQEIRDNVEATNNFNSTQKTAIVKYLRHLHMHMGIPKRFRDVKITKSLLEEFQQWILPIYDNDDCALETILRKIGSFRQLQVYHLRELILPIQRYGNYEEPLFLQQAFHMGETIHILPGFFFTLNGNFPIGFKYGVAWSIGHEIFHGLGLHFRNDPGIHGNVGKMDFFQKQKDCYNRYYGSFCMGNEVCPIGDFKSNEGFADVEGARIVYKVLTRKLKKAAKDERRKQQKWFFKAMTMVFCKDAKSNSEEEQETFLHTDVHPRTAVRANAIALQMPEFTELFHCQKEDFNYVTEERCAIYS